ncbi:thymidine kinase [Haploplasma axanthum]|nr:thymidine kinase [Haploplasma axanthum]
MYQICNHGYIEVVCGPMFAGKTEELIRRINRLEYAKQKYLIFKPAVDDRYSETAIVSHNKNQKQAINIKNSSEIFDYLENDVEVVVIDEAQFFDEGIVKIADKLADKGIRVIVGGLDRDFKGDPFGPMPQLLAIAEFVTKLTAICSVSGMPATRTQRLINGEPAKYDDPIVLIGATESYEPRSRNNHQVPGKEK